MGTVKSVVNVRKISNEKIKMAKKLQPFSKENTMVLYFTVNESRYKLCGVTPFFYM